MSQGRLHSFANLKWLDILRTDFVYFGANTPLWVKTKKISVSFLLKFILGVDQRKKKICLKRNSKTKRNNLTKILFGQISVLVYILLVLVLKFCLQNFHQISKMKVVPKLYPFYHLIHVKIFFNN